MKSQSKRDTPERAEAMNWDEAVLTSRLLSPRWLQYVLGFLAFLLLLLVVTVQLSLLQQTGLMIISIVAALLLRRVGGRVVTIALMTLSFAASLRYMYWRVTATLGFTGPLDYFFGYLLLAAELYALTVMLLSYFQMVWPLQRKTVPLPEDLSKWPTVDVFIPTYNESLSVVRQAVLAATSLDWPAERLRVCLLDDGRRDEFKAFAEAAGVSYFTRENNRYAKAGNINAALTQTDGEYVAVFDCDHVTTRSFLQICMGWFLKDEKLAMLQTPHVFFSPDPFERNLDTYQQVPNESELFYGVVQDGNDLWNATFFCGSCAVIRRSALDAVGGVATESVTEDALTALKMNRAGYNTAYLSIPQAAGLATENLARHIGQRTRWARGMIQILRVNNPLGGKGLHWSQRLCYLSAMLHFCFGLPRMVFLLTPLAYLLFGAQVFHASALMVAVYAIPHIMLSSLTGSRMQGRFRHSFWNEIYETVLAFYILRPFWQTLFDPGCVPFNVTDKGGVIRKDFFDWQLARPYVFLLVFNLIGLVAGVISMLTRPDLAVALTLLINLAWTAYNVVIISAAVGVAGEARQLRNTHRVAMAVPAALSLPDGHRVVCTTRDFSQGGVGITLPDGVETPPTGEKVVISIFRGDFEGAFPATVTVRRGNMLGLNFQDLTIQEEKDLAQVTFARADTWVEKWGTARRDSPVAAMREIVVVSLHSFVLLAQYIRQQIARQWNRGVALLKATRPTARWRQR